MKTLLRMMVPIGAATLAAACGGSPSAAPGPVAQTSPATTMAKPVAVAVAEVKDAPMPASAVPAYEARGRKDPFQPPVSREGAQGTTLSSAKLTGIVRGNSGPLALVETSEGLGYIMKPGDTLGGGRLVEIGPNTVVFSVVPAPGTNTNRVLLKLAGD